MKQLFLVPLLLLGFACGSQQDSNLSAISNKNTLSQKVISSATTYTSLSKPSTGIFQGGRSMKFLIDYRRPSRPSILFMNANYSGICRFGQECAKYHYDFAREALRIQDSVETFNSSTYFSPSKRYFAGTIATYQLAGDTATTYGIQLYPQDVASEAQILEMVRIVKGAFTIPQAKLAFVATGNQQTTATIQTQLNKLNVKSISLNEILGSTKFIPMNVGEAWGYIRLFPKDQNLLAPTDIPVFDELPLDLSVVAGVITRAFQDSNSHINLKSKERGTPNMVLRDVSAEHPVLGPWIDKPVHITVTNQGWTIKSSTDEIVRAKAGERLNKPWVPIVWKSASAVQSYTDMCPNRPADCLKLGAFFGGKAANLGFLKDLFRDRSIPTLPALSYDPVPTGFGVPLQFYKDFLDLPANAAIKAKVDDLIAKEKSGLLSGQERAQLSDEVKKAILAGTVPAANLEQVKAMLKTLAPTVEKWKVRSSANAEDIENFDGAGLHDSFSAKTTSEDKPDNNCKVQLDENALPGDVLDLEVKPKTFSCAMKAVYASLWNKRAIEERSFARIDHASVAMGLAIVPAYDTASPVAANSVVVTRVINSQDVLGYTLSVQKDNNTVTNPLPGTWSETSIVALGNDNEAPSLTTLRFAKPTPESTVFNTTVLSKDLNIFMAQMARKVEVAYCKAKSSYYHGDCNFVYQDSSKPKALDFEMKFLQNGEFVVKQVREFGGK